MNKIAVYGVAMYTVGLLCSKLPGGWRGIFISTIVIVMAYGIAYWIAELNK